MTTSEAIKWFENRKSGSTMPGAGMVFDMALEALREKAARENPEPLTLEELRQMDRGAGMVPLLFKRSSRMGDIESR